MILYPHLAILVIVEVPKLLVKTCGTFRVRRYEKVPTFFEALEQDFWKTNVPTHTAQLEENLKMIQEDEYLNYMTIIKSLNKIIEYYSSQET